MRSFQLILAVFLTFATLTVSAPDNMDLFGGELVPRQNARPTAGEGEPVEGDVSVTTSDGEEQDPEETGTKTKPKDSKPAKGSSKDDEDDKDDKSKPKKSRTTRIPATAQAGRITMKTPAASAGYQIYKIGDTLTFEWNYTDLIITPAAVNVVAYCSDAANGFTITGNSSAGVTRVLWDTGRYQKEAADKLPVASYTLQIFDSKGAVTDSPVRGYLQPFSGLQFGMYTPKQYKPLKDFVCATCDPNLASTLDKYTLRMLIGMGLLAATSFTWFMAGIPL